MPGISGAARLAKNAATSKTTKTAVKKAANSELVKQAVSGIIIDAALPEIKERVAQRLNPDEDIQATEEGQEPTPANLGKWNEPSMLGLKSDLYARYLRNQILVLSQYEIHLEEYESPEYEEHVDSFHTQCEDPMLQLHATQLVAKSVEDYREYIENYAVRNDEFREYVLNGPEKPEIDLHVPSDDSDAREALERMDKYVEPSDNYVEYLLEFTEEDPEFASHVSSYGNPIKGDIQDLENAVIAGLRYLNYLEQYGNKDEEFRSHADTFTPEGEAYYSLIEAENQLLKESQDHST